MLDYMYEGWGFDEAPQGMATLADQNVVAYENQLNTVGARDYTEIGQFVSENGSNYTDLRTPKCGCCK